jgi:myo-inositol-1(or 4)-monophosphatase
MTPTELNKAAATARDALLRAGAILRKGFARRPRVSYKSPVNPVTEVDLRSEKAVIALIRKRFPDHGFLAEESSYLNTHTQHDQQARLRWVIDPLDGTANFLHGVPIACVSIALEQDGDVLTGGVYDPFRDELFLATKGRGATLNGKRIRVSSWRSINHALIFTGFPYDNPTHIREYLRGFSALMKRAMGVRRFGAAAIDLAWVACGRADGFWEYKLKPWDVAAGVLLIKEAGGVVSDLNGRPLDIRAPIKLLSANRSLHPQLIKLLGKKS